MRLSCGSPRWLVLGGLVALITGCGPTNVRSVTAYSGPPLPKPDRVIVVDFAVSPDDVSLNRGLFARLGRQISGTPTSAEQLKVAREVASALSEELVKRIAALGLPAERVSGGRTPEPRALVVEGQFVSVDEGNRLKRVIVGFGAGGSVVKTMSQVWIGTASGPVLAQTFETEAESSRTPGMGPMVGAGAAATGTAAIAAGTSGGMQAITEPKGSVVADAHCTAEALANQLAQFFAVQG